MNDIPNFKRLRNGDGVAAPEPNPSVRRDPHAMAAPTLQRDRFAWLLALRFGVLNITGAALVGAAWAQGWLDGMIATDKYHLVKLNCGVFLIGMALCWRNLRGISYELNQMHRGYLAEPGSRTSDYFRDVQHCARGSRGLLADALRLKVGARLGTVRHVASTVVLVGIVGTVIGFIIAVSGIDASAASDPSAIAPMISTLLLGMAIALYKTLVGSVLNIWLSLNSRLLETGAVHWFAGLVEKGERNA